MTFTYEMRRGCHCVGSTADSAFEMRRGGTIYRKLAGEDRSCFHEWNADLFSGLSFHSSEPGARARSARSGWSGPHASNLGWGSGSNAISLLGSVRAEILSGGPAGAMESNPLWIACTHRAV